MILLLIGHICFFLAPRSKLLYVLCSCLFGWHSFITCEFQGQLIPNLLQISNYMNRSTFGKAEFMLLKNNIKFLKLIHWNLKVLHFLLSMKKIFFLPHFYCLKFQYNTLTLTWKVNSDLGLSLYYCQTTKSNIKHPQI